MLDNPPTMNKQVFGELTDAIMVMKKAAELTIALLEKMAMSVIKQKFQILLDNGHLVPDAHQPVINKQNCVELAEAGEDVDWCELTV